MELQSLKQRFGIIGNSVKLNQALSIADRVASTELTVLISGESGVGKEVFSKIIHQLSSRKHEKFIAVNTGAIPEGTIDSELFGHTKGSFTGATENRKGYFETVNGGTIFLDEISEMPMGTQARLLRVLESGEFIKVGASEVQTTNVRVVAASNVDLVERVRQGKFREDLYFRLSTVPIQVPPLRHRPEDIYLLFRKFVTDFSEKYRSEVISLSPDAQQVLIQYPWPGNVRELKNVAEQISVLANQKEVSADELRGFLPQQNNQLAIRKQDSISERDILYKIMFEMKNDLNNIKKYLLNNGHEAAFANSGAVSNMGIDSSFGNPSDYIAPVNMDIDTGQTPQIIPSDSIIIGPSTPETNVIETSTYEVSLSLADMEKELIQKALEKHRGRRKNAALDLGISERTLYRKIKEYGIKE